MSKASQRATPGKIYGVVRAVLLAGVFAYIAWRMATGWPQIRALQIRWNALGLVVAALSAALAFPCLAWASWILLRRSGHGKNARPAAYLRVWWVSYIYRFVPGRVLVVVERARLGARLGIPPHVGAALAVIETALGILASGWVALLAIPLLAGATRPVLWLVVPLSVAGLFLVPRAFGAFCALPAIRRRYPALETFSLGARDLLTAFVPFILHFLLLGLSFALCVRSVQDIAPSAWPGLAGVYALAHFSGAVSMIAPAGLGVREGAVGLQLARIVPAGVGEAIAVGSRLWFTAMELIGFGIVLLTCPAPGPAEPPPGEDRARGAGPSS